MAVRRGSYRCSGYLADVVVSDVLPGECARSGPRVLVYSQRSRSVCVRLLSPPPAQIKRKAAVTRKVPPIYPGR
jgi:hypothetical protein